VTSLPAPQGDDVATSSTPLTRTWGLGVRSGRGWPVNATDSPGLQMKRRSRNFIVIRTDAK
jgi:hypothetical protein